MALSQGEEISSVLIAVNSYAQAGDELPTLPYARQVLSDYIDTFQHLLFKVECLFDYTLEAFNIKFAEFCEKSVGDHVVVILYGHGGIFNGIECQHTFSARLSIPHLESTFAEKCRYKNRYLLLDICRITEEGACAPNWVYQANTQGGTYIVHSTLTFHPAESNMWSRLLAQNLLDVDAPLDKVIDSVDGQIKRLHPKLQQVSHTQSKGSHGAPNFKQQANFKNISVPSSENLRQPVDKADNDMAAIQPPHNPVMASFGSLAPSNPSNQQRPTDNDQLLSEAALGNPNQPSAQAIRPSGQPSLRLAHNDPLEIEAFFGNPAPNNPSNQPSAQEFTSGPEHSKTLCDNPHIQGLKRRVMNRYKILKPSESRVRVEYVQLALLEAQPYKHHEDEEEMMKLKKGGGKKLDFLESFKSCGFKSGKVRGFVGVADLLKQTRDPDNRMKVVYGQAGIGKTTMLTHICRSLTLDEPMKSSYALVLYFPLRDKVVSSAKSLSNLLSYYASAKSLPAVEQAIEDSSDKEVLFIFDGADEVQDLLSSEERGVFQELLEGRTLPQADVIVSSRPGGLSHVMKQNVPIIYEIHGLPKLSIQNYIKEFFKSSPEKGERLWKELQDRDDLMGGAHIPMNLLIFCHIFGKGDLPPTLTDCYKQFIVEVHNRESPEKKWKRFDRCPDDVKQLLLSLGRLAYNGLMYTPSTFVFEEEEVEEALKPTSLDKSTFKGLLHEHPSISEVYSNNRTFNFSHTTQQELFCAYYISHLPVGKQIEFLKGTLNCSNPMVLRFYAGLTGLVDEKVVHTVLHEPGFFDYPFLPKASTTGQSICARDKLRCDNDDPGLLNLFHFLYESQNSVLTQSVARHLDGKSIEFDLFLTSYDTRVIAHCLRESLSFSHLGFYQDPDSEHLLSCVSSILMSASVTHIQKLTLHLNRLTRTGGSLLKEGLSRTVEEQQEENSGAAVEELDLNVNHADMSAIAAVFEAPGLKTLWLTVLDDVDYSDSDLEVVQSTARNITIKELQVCSKPSLLLPVVKGLPANTDKLVLEHWSLFGIGCNDASGVGQALATTKCTTNTTLKDIQLAHVSPFPLMEVLCSCDSVPLERLAIEGHSVSEDSSPCTPEALETLAQDMKVKRFKSDWKWSAEDYKALADGLSRNKSLKEVDLNLRWNVPDDLRDYISAKLSTLETVKIHNDYF